MAMKILGADIETYPSISYIWDPRTRYVTKDKLAKPGYTACWAAKWIGDDNIYFDSEWRNKEEYILNIYDMLNEADVVLHYNGKKFDIPTLNTEFIKMGLNPPSPIHQIDLYHTVRREFNFLYNGMDYVAKELGIGQKIEHEGMPLWTGCMEGDKDCQRRMQEYNEEDVVLLEKLYLRMLPWLKSHPNHGLYLDDDRPVCPNCDSLCCAGGGYHN